MCSLISIFLGLIILENCLRKSYKKKKNVFETRLVYMLSFQCRSTKLRASEPPSYELLSRASGASEAINSGAATGQWPQSVA